MWPHRRMLFYEYEKYHIWKWIKYSSGNSHAFIKPTTFIGINRCVWYSCIHFNAPYDISVCEKRRTESVRLKITNISFLFCLFFHSTFLFYFCYWKLCFSSLALHLTNMNLVGLMVMECWNYGFEALFWLIIVEFIYLGQILWNIYDLYGITFVVW